MADPRGTPAALMLFNAECLYTRKKRKSTIPTNVD